MIPVSRLSRLVSLALSLGFAAVVPGIAAARCADVALVLAIDASGSIDQAEFDLQSAGYYSALTAPGVQNAFQGAGVVQIAAVLWGDSAYTPQVVPWHRVTSTNEAAAFATALASTERIVTGNTDIATGIAAALDLFDDPELCAERLVIDVSGDGRASVTARRSNVATLDVVRKRAESLGVVINALAITGDDAELGDYFRRRVAVGNQSFVMEVEGFETFHEALIEKLQRELLAAIPPARPDWRVDAAGRFRLAG